MDCGVLQKIFATMFRVNFDAQIFGAQTYGGISRYFASLVRELALIPECSPLILAPWHKNAYLEKLPKPLVRGTRSGDDHLPVGLQRALGILGSSLMHATSDAKVVHRTYYYPFLQFPTSSTQVLTVFDMIHERFPQHFAANDPIAGWKRRAVQRADHIICISQQTKTDLLEAYGDVIRGKVWVTYLGFDELACGTPSETATQFRQRVLGGDAPYILYVGSRGGYKNFGSVLKAFGGSPRLRKDFRLLCFGGGPFTHEEQAHMAVAGVSDRVVQLPGDDAVLSNCYRHAALFVYPSLYEGFGIPPLEAMSMGCPVVCSNVSSIPEVVGDAGAYFDPGSVEHIQSTMEHVLTTPARHAELVKLGHLRTAVFSWRQCAEETAAIYRESLLT